MDGAYCHPISNHRLPLNVQQLYYQKWFKISKDICQFDLIKKPQTIFMHLLYSVFTLILLKDKSSTVDISNNLSLVKFIQMSIKLDFIS